jgi:hypothetical protein
MSKYIDIIKKHIFKDSRFVNISKGDQSLLTTAIEYYIESYLSSLPYLLLFYFDKLQNFEVKKLFNFEFKNKCFFILALLQLSCKWAEDIYYSNKYILKLFGFKEKDITYFDSMEWSILAALDYNLYISESQYDEYVKYIENKYSDQPDLFIAI